MMLLESNQNAAILAMTFGLLMMSIMDYNTYRFYGLMLFSIGFGMAILFKHRNINPILSIQENKLF